jgi:tetratricopeptide (TPR) repeat protein
MALRLEASHPARLLASVLVMLVVPTMGRAQVSWQQEFDRARQLADDGSLREAQGIFDSGVRALTDASPLRAYAYFGRAFVAQQRRTAGDTAGLPANPASMLADYARAEALDQRGIGIAAHNNAGTLLRALGRHAEARREFLAAANAGPHPNRATFYLNAALEFASLPPDVGSDSADWSFRQALKQAPTQPDILRAYSAWLARTLPVPDLLEALAPWRMDTVRAEIAANVLASLLVRKEPPVSAADAAAVLTALAATLPIMEVSPARFGLLFRSTLEQSGVLHPEIAPGARAIIQVLSLVAGDRGVANPETAGWWRRTQESQAAFSGVQRWMGDWYFQQNRQPLAQQFYEAALGDNELSLNSHWVDRRALVPLAMIYVEREDMPNSTKLQQNVEQFTRTLFNAKGDAYARRDLEQIRDFHLALATIYVAKGKWTGPGAESAEFQIEHLRQASHNLEDASGKPAYVPPDLLAKLAVHYQQTGNAAAASTVKDDLRRQLTRQGKAARADVLVRQIDEDSRRPDALKPVQKAMTTYDPSSAGSIAKPLSGRATQQLTTTHITGRVLAPQNAPVAGVAVEVTADGKTYRTVAAENGVFALDMPPGSGDVTVRIAHPGFRVFTAQMKTSDSLQVKLTPVNTKLMQQVKRP